MAQASNIGPTETERIELERVVQALAKWPRLSRLLRYMGDKLFSGEADQLNEYNIATEVLGRSKTVFNAGEDAIARVETHRLRKRLAAFYEKDGRDHPIHVTLPPGSYVPVFIYQAEEGGAPRSPHPSQVSQSDIEDEVRRASRWINPVWAYSIMGAAVALTAVIAYLYLHAGSASTRAKPATGPAPAGLSERVPSGPSPLPVRLRAGYSGPPRTDSAGRVWNQDQYFIAGGSWQRSSAVIARTTDPFLFEHSRTADFSYNIPLNPGSYELHLFFSTQVRADQSLATFNVRLNGEFLLQSFDINIDALGEDIADERVFRDVSPRPDGFLGLDFSSGTATPALNAIEILPGVAHAQLPIRLIMQPTPFTDHQGRFWTPDDYFMSGRLSFPQTHALLDSSDPDLFSGERYGHFTYAIPVDTRDRYTMVLHFAEFYFGSAAPGGGGVGSRIFRVMCNGQTLLDDFDIFKEAGSLHELTKTFRHLKPSAQGKLNLTFEPIVNNATVSGIEVLDESH